MCSLNLKLVRDFLLCFCVVSVIGQLFLKDEMWSLATSLASYF